MRFNKSNQPYLIFLKKINFGGLKSIFFISSLLYFTIYFFDNIDQISFEINLERNGIYIFLSFLFCVLSILFNAYAWKHLLRDYHKGRIIDFMQSIFNPENSNLMGIGYQAFQSKVAIGSGGFFKIPNSVPQSMKEFQRSKDLITSVYELGTGYVHGIESTLHDWVLGYKFNPFIDGPSIVRALIDGFVERAVQ